MLPFLTHEAPWFAFIGHPRSKIDLDRISSMALLRRYSVDEADFLRKVRLIPPIVVGQIMFRRNAVVGEIIAAMCMPDHMVSPSARVVVRDAIRLAATRGARAIGLGALTSPATGAGQSVLKEIPHNVVLTTGNAYTAAVAARNVEEARTFVRNSDPHVAVLGCTGSVGFAVSHLLAQAGYRLTLIGRNTERAKSLFGGLVGKVEFAGNLQVLSEVDVLVILTNDASAKVRPELLSPGAVIIDIAQPPNIPRDCYQSFEVRDISVFEGGLAQIPGYTCTFDFGLPEATTFACLAETYIFAREGITEHSTGRAQPEMAKYLDQLADKHHITTLPLSHAPKNFCPKVVGRPSPNGQFAKEAPIQ